MYFYDSYESIEVDQDGEYFNYIKELDLSEKLNYINSKKFYLLHHNKRRWKI